VAHAHQLLICSAISISGEDLNSRNRNVRNIHPSGLVSTRKKCLFRNTERSVAGVEDSVFKGFG